MTRLLVAMMLLVGCGGTEESQPAPQVKAQPPAWHAAIGARCVSHDSPSCSAIPSAVCMKYFGCSASCVARLDCGCIEGKACDVQCVIDPGETKGYCIRSCAADTDCPGDGKCFRDGTQYCYHD